MRLEQFPQYLPHISRDNTRIILSLVLAVVIVFSLLSNQNMPAKNSQFTAITNLLAQDPTNPTLHQQLANLYLQTDNLEAAKQEVLLALKYSPAPIESGPANRDLANQRDQISSLQQAPAEIKDKIDKLVEIVRSYPSYRDGYLMLGVYYWQIYQDGKAQEAIDTALRIDPNYQLTKTIKSLISTEN